MARVGVGGGSTPPTGWVILRPLRATRAPRVVTCQTTGTEFQGRGAAGVLTHLGVEIGIQHGLVFGTTTARAIEMGREAGLSLALVFP